MDLGFSFYIRFSGITVRFELPTSVNLPECFTNLMCENTTDFDAEYRVCLIDSPLCPKGTPVYVDGGIYVYNTEQGCLRIYKPLIAEDGCQVACLLSKEGKNIMYYPKSKWDFFREYWHCTHLLCGELLLLYQNSFLLHSSLVLKDGKTVLFSAPSGVGKSTQASLWEQYAGAEVLNGDRSVIMKKNGVFYAGGSLWSGTSGIYSPKQAPVAAIFILKQAEENRVKKLDSKAFVPLFSQTTVNHWDENFVKTITDIYNDLLTQIPVYELQCTPDKGAVELAYKTVFGKELNE